MLKLEGSRKGVFNSAQIGKGLFHSFLGPRGAWVLNRLFSYTGASQVALLVKYPPANAGEARDNKGSISGSRRSPGVGNGAPLQYSCLENSMGRGAWWATVHGATKSWALLSIAQHYCIDLVICHS